jgi:hypothetical protein
LLPDHPAGKKAARNGLWHVLPRTNVATTA